MTTTAAASGSATAILLVARRDSAFGEFGVEVEASM
jgi:hypothetical protein